MADATPVTVTPKPWYTSRTIWLNILGIIGTIATYASGHLGAGETIGSVLFGASGIALRSVTSAPLTK